MQSMMVAFRAAMTRPGELAKPLPRRRPAAGEEGAFKPLPSGMREGGWLRRSVLQSS